MIPTEIERKFLVTGPVPLSGRPSKKILQGYLPATTKLEIRGDSLVITPLVTSARAPSVVIPLSKCRTGEISASALQLGVIDSPNRKVLRIRIENDEQAVFCMKVDPAQASSFERPEVEFDVEFLDAMYLIQACRELVLRKIRHEVQHAGRLWEVDTFADPFNGLITAEIELASVSDLFDVPPWVGPELTHLPEFSNRALAEAQRIPEFALRRFSK